MSVFLPAPPCLKFDETKGFQLSHAEFLRLQFEQYANEHAQLLYEIWWILESIQTATPYDATLFAHFCKCSETCTVDSCSLKNGIPCLSPRRKNHPAWIGCNHPAHIIYMFACQCDFDYNHGNKNILNEILAKMRKIFPSDAFNKFI